MNASFVDTTRFSNQNCLTKMKKETGSFKKKSNIFICRLCFFSSRHLYLAVFFVKVIRNDA